MSASRKAARVAGAGHGIFAAAPDAAPACAPWAGAALPSPAPSPGASPAVAAWAPAVADSFLVNFMNSPKKVGAGQGLPLVHFSAQPEPF